MRSPKTLQVSLKDMQGILKSLPDPDWYFYNYPSFPPNYKIAFLRERDTEVRWFQLKENHYPSTMEVSYHELTFRLKDVRGGYEWVCETVFVVE